MEDRVLPATITVTGTGDAIAVDGVVTLREAIESTNGGTAVNTDVVPTGSFGTNDRIEFNIPGAGVRTIRPTSELPGISKPVTLDGYTQPGAKPNTLAVGNNAALLIEINGGLVNFVHGLVLMADNCTVRGLVVNGFSRQPGIGGGGVGIYVFTGRGCVIAGNFLGTDPTGTLAFGNGNSGVFVQTVNNRVGGADPADRNLLSGNAGNDSSFIPYGITLTGGDNTVAGNYIGTDATGTKAISNGGGVQSIGSNNIIGGTAPGAGNVVSGNNQPGTDGRGIFINGGSGTVVQGNFVGTDVSGTRAVPNHVGVVVNGPHTVGGTTPAARNLISGNETSGVEVRGNLALIEGNFIGTDATGTLAVPNGGRGVDLLATQNVVVGGTAPGAGNLISRNGAEGVFSQSGGFNAVLGNAIFANGKLGINLVGGSEDASGATANDSGDADVGPNNLQNYPVITSVTSGGGDTTIAGTLNSTPNTTFTVEFFNNDFPDPSSFGEGQTFLGRLTNVTTDANGDASFTATLPVTVSPTQFVTATATDPNNNTSEFSQLVADLGVDETGSPANATVGQVLVFTATVTNAGPFAATGVELTDRLPAVTTFISATGGATPDSNGVLIIPLGTVTVGATTTVTVVLRATATGTINNPVTVSSTVDDLKPADNNATARVTVTAPASADLSVSVTDSPDPVAVGGNLTYTVTATNRGPSASAVTLTDTLPAGVRFVSATGGVIPSPAGVLTFRLGTLTSGGHATVTIVVRPNAKGTLTDRATVAGSVADPASANNSASQGTTVNAPAVRRPDLAVAVVASPDAVAPGALLTYNITVRNLGPVRATDIRLVDALPAGARFVSTSAGRFDAARNRIVADLGTLAVGASRIVTIRVRPKAAAAGTTLVNSVVVATAQTDPNPANNAALARARVVAPPAGAAAPTVVDLARFGFHAQPTLLVLTFSGPLDRARVENLANYRLVGPGGLPIPIASAAYNAASRTVTLRPGVLMPLRRVFTLTVNGTGPSGLADPAGRLVDGDRDGRPGGDFVAPITGDLLTSPSIGLAGIAGARAPALPRGPARS